MSFSVDFTLLGGATVFLLLASQNVESLLSQVHVDVSFCVWLLFMAGSLMPLTCLDTPQDFW